MEYFILFWFGTLAIVGVLYLCILPVLALNKYVNKGD